MYTGPIAAADSASAAALAASGAGDDGASAYAFVALEHDDTEATRAVWPHAFRVRYEVRVSCASATTAEVTCALDVTNRNADDTDFTFTTALHTYFAVSDVRDVRVVGLRGTTYRDKLRDYERVDERADELALSGATDRVYERAFGARCERALCVNDARGKRRVELRTTNLPDAVVWNPWHGHAVADLAPHERMVCVEAGAIAVNDGGGVRVCAGCTWRGAMQMSLAAL
mmetsp:Transcript_41627/g.102410  ORF Transcript_41627/g.102410 Transcript_41627/m.102410 type:complete len:229 (-) Transcript_41627:79-765(-)